MAKKGLSLLLEASKREEETLKKERDKSLTKNSKIIEDDEIDDPSGTIESEVSESTESDESKSKPKHAGGRPKNASLGKALKKGRTIQLTDEKQALYMGAASKMGVSLSVFMDIAAFEYLTNHHMI